MAKITKIVKIGNLKIGGKNPVRIKGMLKNRTSKIKGLIKEARTLEKEGAEAIRIAVKEKEDARLAALLKKYLKTPLVADVHFNPDLALLAIEKGFDSIRLNPLNIDKEKDVRPIARMAKKYSISIRVGVNSGGFRAKFRNPLGLAQAMVSRAERYLKILEQENFFDIMVSLKGSDTQSTLFANRIFSQKHDYPLHLGITASGPFLEGVVKSSVGLGNLLCAGIGNVIRVSLTGPSYWEIRVARYILEALNLRQFGPRVISCPTCSRCEVNLFRIVEQFEKKIREENLAKPLRIAIMGCVVNGPGEASQADIGVAFGKKKAVIFKNNKILGYTSENKVVRDLLGEVRRIWT
jgi:(E)-4-hydroxy-3-methylbut-2-enyl-diphosphate synthase